MDAVVSDTMAEQQNAEIERTVRQERGRLFNFIRKRVRHDDDAQDILQDVFWQLIDAYRRLETIERVTSWLFQVARNKIADTYRSKKPEAMLQTKAEREDGTEMNLQDNPCGLVGKPRGAVHPRRHLERNRNCRGRTASATTRCFHLARIRGDELHGHVGAHGRYGECVAPAEALCAALSASEVLVRSNLKQEKK